MHHFAFTLLYYSDFNNDDELYLSVKSSSAGALLGNTIERNQIKHWYLRRGENRSTRRKTYRDREENQQTQPTHDKRRRDWKWNPGLIGGRRAISILSQSCSPDPTLTNLENKEKNTYTSNLTYLVIEIIVIEYLWIKIS